MNKVLTGRNYGSIPHLLDSKLGDHDKYIHKGQDAIIRKGGRDKHDIVHVSLKLDGTNVGVKRDGDDLIPVQRKGYHCKTSPYKQHHEFALFVEANEDQFMALLDDGQRIAGEWMYQASGIRYEIKKHPFFPFDLFNVENKRMPWQDLVLFVGMNSNFEVPPSTSYSFKEPQESFDDLVKAWYCNAMPIDDKHEGLVYRVERKGEFDFMAKWVRQDFEAGRYLPGVRGNNTDITLNKLTQVYERKTNRIIQHQTAGVGRKAIPSRSLHPFRITPCRTTRPQ